MSARKLLAALLALLVLGHVAAPYVVVIIAADVTLFAITCTALGWLLATTRCTWTRPRLHMAGPGYLEET